MWLPMFISYFRFCFEVIIKNLATDFYGFMLKQKLLFRELKSAEHLLWQYCLQAYLCFSYMQTKIILIYLSPSFLIF
jgi:hypothetical protein